MNERGDYIPESILDERDQLSQRLLRFMDKIHANEVFHNETTKRDFIDQLDYQGFVELLTAANAILRDQRVHKHGMDGDTVHLSGGIDDSYYPPDPDQKIVLLQEMLDYAKQMNHEQRDMNDIALLVGASINAIHPFMDANGRTSRLGYTLLARDFPELEDGSYLTAILGEEGRQAIDINPIFIEGEIESEIRANYLGMTTDDPTEPRFFWSSNAESTYKQEVREALKESDLSEADQDLLITTFISDGTKWWGHGFLSIYKFLKDRNQLTTYAQSFDRDDGTLSHSVLVAKPIIEHLTHEDAEEIQQNYRRIKELYVRTLMDTIAHPDRHLVEEPEGESRTVKQIFMDRIENHSKAETEVAEN